MTKPAPAVLGSIAFGGMLALYFGALTLVSGWRFTLEQFSQYWIYVLSLPAGFGVQVALYSHLRRLLLEGMGSRTVLAASGTTSTAAMVSCCAHYLTNLAPVLGAAGLGAAQRARPFIWSAPESAAAAPTTARH